MHVLAEEIFATEIHSEADDYRYATRTGHGAELRPLKLPADVADRCRELTRALGLTFAGIDLRRSLDDEWYCFEVNPSPGFSYYQAHTGVAIDLAVARVLAGGAERARLLRRSRTRRDASSPRLQLPIASEVVLAQNNHLLG